MKIILLLVANTILMSCSNLPERKEVASSSNFLGRMFTTERPLTYQTQLPRYDEVTSFIRGNSFTLFAEEVDRRITKIRNECSGCLRAEMLKTPIRVEYIPIGTGMTVEGEYLYYQKKIYFSPTTVHMLIVRDEFGNRAEIPESAFASSFSGRSPGKDQETDFILQNIDLFQQHKTLRLNFCLRDSVDKSVSPLKFISDFKMQSEVTVTFGVRSCTRGYKFEFKTLEAYLTSLYYFRNWGLFGRWMRV